MSSYTINGVTYQSNSQNPYGDIANAYAQQVNEALERQRQALADQLVSSKSSAAANYDSNAAAAYLDYLRQSNMLPENLRAQGVTGGASESALTRLSNNYAMNQSANNASRAQAMSQLQNTYNTNLAQLEQDAEEAIRNNSVEMAQLQAQYTDQLNQRALEQYSATIERYTSVKSIDKAIKALSTADPNYEAKRQLLELRRAQLKGSKSGKGGKGSKGYGRSSAGGASDIDVEPTSNAPSLMNSYRKQYYTNRSKSGGGKKKATGKNKGYFIRG